MEKLISNVNRFLVFVAGLGLIILMLLIFAGVITRYVFGFSIPTSYEIVEQYLMPLTIFVALGYSFKSGIFPRVDSFVENIKSEQVKKIINISVLILELILFAFITYLLFEFAFYSLETEMGFRSNGIAYLLFPIHLVIAISFLWTTVIMIHQCIKAFKNEDIDVLENTEEKNLM
ncbi:hypothetical protein GCM10008931_44950 [Oceanobacillus oncorhynchi subsp. oncorhynchi]|uniref:TRAP transporter small permease n=1 Tax=Oceanobacillus oncorhynchi TaxID=545501 RepID=UPI0031D3D093